jgi:hypothetical protein
VRPDQTDPGVGPRQSRPDALADRRRGDTADGTTTADGGTADRTTAEGPSVDGAIVDSWQDIKSRFVDDPSGALAAAEQLVRMTVEHKIRALKDEAAAVCAAERDDDPTSTEAQRTRLLRYQEYCERLAAASIH